MGSSSRRLLNPPTQLCVSNPTASKERHGPPRWITSAFESITRLGESAVVVVADAAGGRLGARVSPALGVADACSPRATAAAMHEAAPRSGATLVKTLLKRIQRQVAMSRPALPRTDNTPMNCAESHWPAARPSSRAPTRAWPAMPIVSSGSRPLSTSAFFTHPFSVCAGQPILAAIDIFAALRWRPGFMIPPPYRAAQRATQARTCPPPCSS